MNTLFQTDETPSRLDKLGTSFIEDSESVTNDEAFELLSSLFHVSHREMAEYFHGREFKPETERVKV